jgi:hypothetical protein
MANGSMAEYFKFKGILGLAKQALYHLSYAPTPFDFSLFFR